MPIVSLEQALASQGQLREWSYNALDVTGTREVFDALAPRLDKHSQLTYDFERSLQAPAFTMTLRGIRVDLERRKRALAELRTLGGQITGEHQ